MNIRVSNTSTVHYSLKAFLIRGPIISPQGERGGYSSPFRKGCSWMNLRLAKRFQVARKEVDLEIEGSMGGRETVVKGAIYLEGKGKTKDDDDEEEEETTSKMDDDDTVSQEEIGYAVVLAWYGCYKIPIHPKTGDPAGSV